MARIVSKAMQVRLNYQQKVGRPVTQQEVVEKTGIARLTLRRIERGETSGVDFDVLMKLCEFYGVGVGDLLEYERDTEKNGTPGLVTALIAA